MENEITVSAELSILSLAGSLIPGILKHASEGSPQLVTCTTPEEADKFRHRILNHIKRHAPEMKGLMVSLHGNQVKVRIPQVLKVELLE